METFVNKLRKLTGVSREYAVAAWFTMNYPENPKQAAVQYYRRFFKRV